MPGGVKNAIDYLYNEWKGKPIAVVTYSIFGSAFASDQLSESLSKLGLQVAATRPQLAFAGHAGPDFFAASGAGELGQATRDSWDAERAKDVVQALDEVKTFLLAPAGQAALAA
jgi:NAD(P)H-dependent FMN reductase